MKAFRRLTLTGLVVTLGFVPAVLALTVYAAVGALAGIAGAIGVAVELAHAGATGLAKHLPLGHGRSA
jgi:hypothetical protein